jgi:hypothetical protein
VNIAVKARPAASSTRAEPGKPAIAASLLRHGLAGGASGEFARPARRRTTCTGRDGDAATKPAPGMATTSGGAGASENSPADRRVGSAIAPAGVNHTGMPAATVITEPERHALVMPQDCDCGMCAPTWARRRGKSRQFSEPVTLAAALTRENPAARPGMVAQHCACLTAMTSAISCEAAAEEPDELGSPELGLPLVLFAGELAAALQPGQFRGELPGNLVQVCEQTVTTATLAAAGCLAGLVETVQALYALAG